jgi:hypothetical protein
LNYNIKKPSLWLNHIPKKGIQRKLNPFFFVYF